MYEDVVVIKM